MSRSPSRSTNAGLSGFALAACRRRGGRGGGGALAGGEWGGGRGGGRRLAGGGGAPEPLRERGPEIGRVRIALEGLPERGDRLGEPPRLRGHLRDHELVVRVGPGVQRGRGTPRRRVEGRRDRPSGGARGERHARQEKRGSDEEAADHRSAPRSAGNRQAFVSRRRAAAARAGSGIGEIASSIARRSAAPSGAEERGRLRGAAEGPASSSVPRVNRSARTAGNRARSRAVSSSARSVSSWSHGELSTITVRQPSTSPWGLARRATSAPTRVDHTRLTWCSASRSRSSGTAVTSRSATARGAPTLIPLYHTPSARMPRGRSAIVAAVMAKPRRGDSLELVIDDLAFGGEGVGRVNGYVVFVRGAVPGDRVRVKLVDARSRFGRAVIESIEVPSPDRVEPPCPYFGRCGGCRLQHIAYPAQLAFKEKQVRDCLERIGGLGAFELRPILPAPEPYGYRNKMEFTITSRAGPAHLSQATHGGRGLADPAHLSPATHRGRGLADPAHLSQATHGGRGLADPAPTVVGLHQADRYDVVLDIERCLLQSEAMNALLDAFRREIRARALSVYEADAGLLRFVSLREGHRTGEAMVNIVATTPDVEALAPLAAEDRKSTRLNSSHSQISYAVFCLKKKTT